MTRHEPNPGPSRRTFTRQQLEDSRAAWDAGDFSDEWRDWRHLAAMQAGIIDPPEGSKWDSWGDDDASDRALLIRAIREQPKALRAALTSGRCHTWKQVIREVVQERDRMTEDVYDREREAAHVRRQQVSRDEAATTLRRIRELIGGGAL